jgi:hypothetical protein
LTGSGRAFSAGADIREFAQDVAHRPFVRCGQAMTARIESFSKPVIAAANGLATAEGLPDSALEWAARITRFAPWEAALPSIHTGCGSKGTFSH